MALAIGLKVEWRTQPLRHLDLLAQFGDCLFRQEPRQFRVVEAIAMDRLGDPVVDAALEQQERIGEEVIGAEKVAPHADRPGGRGHVERQRLLDLVQQVERVAAFAVELIDKGDDRHVAQPADLEELAGLLLDALGGVEHHHGAVDRGQRAVGVLAEILVARCVEQVKGEPLMLEAHHRRGDRDAALALDRHPIRAHPPPLAARLDFTRQLDSPAKQQQFLGQGGLAGVGVRDDRKRPPARNLVGQGAHSIGFSGCR